MRVVLAAEGTRGDVHPMLALGVRLRAAGHAVRLCASPDFAEEAAAQALEFHPVGRSVRELLSAQAAAIHSGPLGVLRAAREYMQETVNAQFAALGEAAADAELLVGAGVQLAAASVAERWGIPYRYVAYCPAMFPSREHAPPMLEWQPGSRLANRVGWWLTIASLRFGPVKLVDRKRRALGLRPIEDVGRYVLSARPLVAVDRELAEVPPDAPLPVEQIPCLHPFDPDAPLPPKLETFLDAGPPPVYLGFGSMPDPRPGETTARLLEAVRARGVRAVISRGWAGLGEGPLPENVFVTDAVPHAALFPRTAGIVHHGGAGTTAMATRAGVPQLVVPHLLDQFYWAYRVRALGLGPPALRRRDLSPERLADAIAELVDNEVLAERARDLGERTRHRAAAGFDLSLLLGT
jgi:UDP:flavonoid glycosyltransferase YjiC (YdhE family)